MKTERDTARLMREWMQEPAELDDRGLFDVLHQLPDTQQRRHRWLWPFDWRPFGVGATRSAGSAQDGSTRRSTHMLTATQFVSAAIVMTLGGAAALYVGLAQIDDDGSLGAESSSVATDADTPFLEALHAPDGAMTKDLAAEAFTEDATFTMVWAPDSIDVDPDREHIAFRFTDPMRATRTQPLVDLPAVEGEQRFVGIYDFSYPHSGQVRSWPGTVCSAWLRDGAIYRLDCVFPGSVQATDKSAE